MPKSTFLATDPNGKVHKRTSENRTYSHCVAVREGTATAERKFEAGEGWRRKLDAENFTHAFKRQTVEAVKADLIKNGCAGLASDDAYVARCVARNVEFVKDCATVEEYVEKQAAARRSKFEGRKADGEFETFGIVGWCSRADLAVKLANQQKGYDEVVILEATVKGA